MLSRKYTLGYVETDGPNHYFKSICKVKTPPYSEVFTVERGYEARLCVLEHLAPVGDQPGLCGVRPHFHRVDVQPQPAAALEGDHQQIVGDHQVLQLVPDVGLGDFGRTHQPAIVGEHNPALPRCAVHRAFAVPHCDDVAAARAKVVDDELVTLGQLTGIKTVDVNLRSGHVKVLSDRKPLCT
jgi:hypothetical protein